MTERITIASLRKELGLTLDELAEQLGISSKGYLSQIERGVIDCSLSIALRIEEFSGGRIDAASLSRDVNMARASCAGGCSPDTSETDAPSPGSCAAISPDDREINPVAGGSQMPPAADGVASPLSATPEACDMREARA